MTGEVVHIGVPHHLLIGHIGSDQAVAIEGDVAHRVPGAMGKNTVRLESLPWLSTLELSRQTFHYDVADMSQAFVWRHFAYTCTLYIFQPISHQVGVWDMRMFNLSQTCNMADVDVASRSDGYN